MGASFRVWRRPCGRTPSTTTPASCARRPSATIWCPAASDTPSLLTGSTVTPSPTNPLGVKGVGEAGTIASTPAVMNAVVDALAPLGVRNMEMPATPERIWRALAYNS